jgi:hypothetical protein
MGPDVRIFQETSSKLKASTTVSAKNEFAETLPETTLNKYVLARRPPSSEIFVPVATVDRHRRFLNSEPSFKLLDFFVSL